VILLSEVIAKIACRQAEPEHLDPLLGMGMALTTGDHGQASVEAAVALTVQAGMFRTLHSMYLPQAPDSKSLVAPLLNDLYTVNFETDGDGLVHVRIPFPDSEPLNSEMLGLDWRVVGLTWAALGNQQINRGVIEALRPTKPTVYAMLDIAALQAFRDFVELMLGPAELRAVKAAGPQCPTCALRGACRTWQTFMETSVAYQTREYPADVQAQRMLTERVDVDVRMEALEARRKEIDKTLRSLATSDGRIPLGAGMALDLGKQSARHWDAVRVLAIFSRAGISESSVVEINEKKMEALLPTLRYDVRKKLERTAAIPYTHEASVKEAIRHAARTGTVQNVIFRGTSAREQGPI